MSNNKLVDYRDKILSELGSISKKEALLKNNFKVRAYQKVIKQIEKLDKVQSFDDLKSVSGIGTKIREKINEILETGKLRSAERARQTANLQAYDPFLNIHGIGITKAKEIVDIHGIKTIEELQQAVDSGKEILNTTQKAGLQYYYDIQKRIPRVEVEKHLRKISKIVKGVDKDMTVKMVGSYRRGEPDSGDIDIIITRENDQKNKKTSKTLDDVLHELRKDRQKHHYIVSELASGKKKFLGICKLKKDSTARRIDILFTNEEEYPYALVYFTGDFEINTQLRRAAKELGYSLSEHGMTPLDVKTPKVKLSSERAIFNFLGFKYLQPKLRSIGNLVKIDT